MQEENINILELEKELNNKYSKIVYKSLYHILKKILKDDIDKKIKLDEIKEIISNYQNYTKFLNDYSTDIYKIYNSSIDEIYLNLCEYFQVEPDNISLYKFRIKKLNISHIEKFELLDDDIQEIIIKKYQKNLNLILNSKYYQNNIHLLSNDIKKFQDNLNSLLLA
jgi:hypothetical protein